jgi:hypothetical protein
VQERGKGVFLAAFVQLLEVGKEGVPLHAGGKYDHVCVLLDVVSGSWGLLDDGSHRHVYA